MERVAGQFEMRDHVWTVEELVSLIEPNPIRDPV